LEESGNSQRNHVELKKLETEAAAQKGSVRSESFEKTFSSCKHFKFSLFESLQLPRLDRSLRCGFCRLGILADKNFAETVVKPRKTTVEKNEAP